MMNWFQNQPLSKKLLLVMLIAGLAPALIITLIALNIASSDITRQAYNQLEAVREMKASAIERYFDRVSNQITIMAASPNIVTAANEFNRSFHTIVEDEGWSESARADQRSQLESFYRDQFDQKYQAENNGKPSQYSRLLDQLDASSQLLQYKYIQDNENPLGEKHRLDRAGGDSPYHQTHAQYHPAIRDFLEKFGFYDIFIVDIQTGKIIYSVFKELDFATSLTTGPYRNTNFAETFNTASQLNRGETTLTDYQPYLPSYEAPASFMGTPIFQQGEAIAVLIFQMPLDPINEIMSQRDGMGQSGEAYLVGEDRLMRSDSFLDPEFHSVAASFRQPDKGRVETEATKRAFSGETGTSIIRDYNGNPVLSAYRLLNLKNFSWAILAEIDESEALAGVNHLKVWVTAIGTLSIIVLILLSLYISKIIAHPILKLGQAIQQVEREGNFLIKIDNEHSDEVGSTSRAFNQLLDNLSNVINSTNQILTNMTQGNFNDSANEHFPGELGALTRNVNKAKQQIKDATRAQQEQSDLAQQAAKKADEAAKKAQLQADETRVIKQALDVSATAVMIADEDFNIIYVNHSLNALMSNAEQNIRKQIPTFSAKNLIGKNMDSFHENPAHQRNMLASLNSTFDTEINAGGSIITLTVTPVKNDRGDRLGMVVEWFDKTHEVSIENEIDKIVDAAAQGDFSKTIDESNKSGFFLTISAGLNRLLSTTNVALSDIINIFSCLSKGDLSQKIEREYAGEFGRLKTDINNTVDKLNEIIFNITKGSEEIANASKEIYSGNADLSQRTEEQAAALEQTSSNMSKILELVKASETNVQDANSASDSSIKQARLGNQSVQQTISAMKDISESSEQISNIITVIDDIAFQTNLLALNAAVEAARAGEQGRGFAVVAGEVRNLAQRSASAAKEIKSLINQSVEKVDQGSKLVQSSGSTLTSIVDEIERVGKMLNELLLSTQEQSTGINEVNTAISEMDEITQRNAALVEEASAASESMSEQADKLHQTVSFFSR